MQFRFDEYTLDPERRELRRAGALLSVEPKVFDLLLHLLRSNGRLSTHDEMLAAVWPDVRTTAGSLNRAISLARAALADRGRAGARILETVRGRGYRISVPISIEDGAADASDFVGRDRELAALAEGLERAEVGSGAAVFVAGRGGIGKTRLLQEFASRAAMRGAVVAWASCFEERGSPGFWPWMQIVSGLVRELGAARVERALGDEVACLNAFVPDFARSESAPVDRPRQFAAVARLLQVASAERAVVLMLDDAHGADDTSLELLRFVASGARSQRLFIAAAHRPGEARQSWLESMDACRRVLGHVERFDLAGLSRDEIEQLSRGTVGALDADELWRRSEGHPFFARQLLRHARRGGTGRVPASVRDAVSVQLDRLDAVARRLLALAASIGREFDCGVLALAAGLSKPTLMESLQPAIELGILDEATQASIGALRFEHALVWETVYAIQPPEARRSAHEQLVDAFEASAFAREDLRIEALARHCAAAGLDAKASRYAERAARRAVEQLAFERAIDLYRQAVEFESSLPGTDPRRRCDLLVALADAEFRVGDFRASEATSWRAIEMARELDAVEVFGRIAVRLAYRRQGSHVGAPADRVALFGEALEKIGADDLAMRARLMTGLAVDLFWTEPARAESLLRDALAIARRAGDPDTLLTVLDELYQLVHGARHDAERRAINDEMLELSVRQRDLEFEFFTRKHRFHEVVRMADARGAEREIAEMERLRGRLRQRLFSEEVRIATTARALWRGDLEAAEASIQLPDALDPGTTDFAFFVFGAQFGLLRRMQGRGAELVPLFRQGIERFPLIAAFRGALALILCDLKREEEAREAFEGHMLATRNVVTATAEYPLNLAIQAEVAAHVGTPEEQRALYERVAEHEGQNFVVGSIVCLGAADRLLGGLAGALGRCDDARAHLERAVEIDRAFGSLPFEAWSRRDLARHADVDGDSARAARERIAASELAARAGIAL